LLRERLSGLERHFESNRLKETARRNLSKNLKPLIQKLYDAGDDRQRLRILEALLTEHYSATSIRIYAAALNGKRSHAGMDLLRPLDPWRRGLFTLILNNRRPLCDSLQYEHLIALFAEDAEILHSSVLLPFRYQGKEALLAVGSPEWHKYAQSVELDILTAVVEVLSNLTEVSSD
jgi:uncharacterized protein YigA (DUF484 family)